MKADAASEGLSVAVHPADGPAAYYSEEFLPVSVSGTAYLVLKRAFDLVFSLLSMILLSPLMLCVAACIKAEDGGPVIHKRLCTGKCGCTYKMYKFRSMKVDADNLERWLSREQILQYRREVKIDNDPRITRCGRIIRKLSIDELPQLFSILKGDMSFVGPRPMTQEESTHFGRDSEAILCIKPGLTGYWQVNGRSDCTYESGRRQQLELYYAGHRCLRLDLRILLKTVFVILDRKGAR